MLKKMICIKCPTGCLLTVDTMAGKVHSVEGNRCPNGIEYAVSETEHPVRDVTSTVRTQGLALQRIPVRSDQPVPKEHLNTILHELKNFVLTHPVSAGEVIIHDIAKTGRNIIATRSCS